LLIKKDHSQTERESVLQIGGSLILIENLCSKQFVLPKVARSG
jgi:hypothetical protein